MIKRILKGCIGLLAVALVVMACSKDQDDQSNLLGKWIEESPVGGRTELNFHSINRVSRTTDGLTDDYYYRIIGNSIFLRPQDAPEEVGESELFFRQTSENSFQIENLYVSIPENETTYMIFRRKAASEDNEEQGATGDR